MKAFIAAGIMLLAAPTLRAAETSYTASASTESRVWLNGDSTLHPYAATATPVALTAVFDGPQLKNLKVKVPVEKLSSGEKGLDKNMHKALKGAENPEISFDVSDPTALTGTGDDASITAPGQLSIAGVTRPATITAEIRKSGDGFRVTGHYPLLMTDFGVKPPSILGMVKTRNEVTVGFDLQLQPAR